MKPQKSRSKRAKPRLFYPSTYWRYSWYDCALKAKARRKHLEAVFASFALEDPRDKRLLVINTELEVLDDYMDWLNV